MKSRGLPLSGCHSAISTAVLSVLTGRLAGRLRAKKQGIRRIVSVAMLNGRELDPNWDSRAIGTKHLRSWYPPAYTLRETPLRTADSIEVQERVIRKNHILEPAQ